MNKAVKHRQKGQALPLGLAFLMGAVLFGITMFDTSQLASEKSRLANTADAAVYSGLIWQARALNFQAYTNRAMVANQVAIGQMVSVAAWTKFGSITARNIDSTLGMFPPAKGFTSAAKKIIDQIDDAVLSMVEGFIPVIDSVNSVLSTSQEALYLSSFAAMPSIVKEVVDRNDSRYSVNSAYSVIGQGRSLIEWRALTKQYEDNEALLRKAEIVNRSKDQFTAGRDVGHRELGLPKINLAVIRFSVQKEGRTNLVIEEGEPDQFGNSSQELEWEWKGKDTFSLHVEKYGCDWRGCGWSKSEIPVGWGSRYVNGDFECEENEDGQEECKKYMRKNKTAELFADLESDEIDADYEGVRAYYDLKDLSKNNKDPRLVLRIEVQLSGDQLRTSSQLDGLGSAASAESRTGMGAGTFNQEEKMLANTMASISSGEVYFHPPDDYRPDRRNGKIEIANLFSPYWDVRLIKTPIVERMMAWGLRDASFLSDGISGIATGVEDADFSASLSQGLNRVSQVSLGRYQRELASAEGQVNNFANQFEEQFVDQISEQLDEGVIEGAVSSFGF